MLSARGRPATSWVHYTTSSNTQSSAPVDGKNNCPKHVYLTGIINKPLLLHLVGCLYYLYQWCTVKQISVNEMHLLIKYIKSVLWRIAKRLSYIEDAWCLKVNASHAWSFDWISEYNYCFLWRVYIPVPRCESVTSKGISTLHLHFWWRIFANWRRVVLRKYGVDFYDFSLLAISFPVR